MTVISAKPLRNTTEVSGMGGQDVILTRADLPTPPEPNTTSLYSRMAGSLHRTAQQSALDKQGEKQNERWETQREADKRNKIFSRQLLKRKTMEFSPSCVPSFSTSERKDSSHSWRLWTRSSTMEGTPIREAAAGWRR